MIALINIFIGFLFFLVSIYIYEIRNKKGFDSIFYLFCFLVFMYGLIFFDQSSYERDVVVVGFFYFLISLVTFVFSLAISFILFTETIENRYYITFCFFVYIFVAFYCYFIFYDDIYGSSVNLLYFFLTFFVFGSVITAKVLIDLFKKRSREKEEEKKKKESIKLMKCIKSIKLLKSLINEVKKSNKKNIIIENEIPTIEKMVSLLSSLDKNFISKYIAVMDYIDVVKNQNTVRPFLKDSIAESKRIIDKKRKLKFGFDDEKNKMKKELASLLTKANVKQKERIKEEENARKRKNNIRSIEKIVAELHAHDYYFLDNYKKVLRIIYNQIDPELEIMDVDVSDEISIDDAREMIEKMRGKT